MIDYQEWTKPELSLLVFPPNSQDNDGLVPSNYQRLIAKGWPPCPTYITDTALLAIEASHRRDFTLAERALRAQMNLQWLESPMGEGERQGLIERGEARIRWLLAILRNQFPARQWGNSDPLRTLEEWAWDEGHLGYYDREYWSGDNLPRMMSSGPLMRFVIQPPQKGSSVPYVWRYNPTSVTPITSR